MIYMNEATYWKKVEIIGSMLCFWQFWSYSCTFATKRSFAQQLWHCMRFCQSMGQTKPSHIQEQHIITLPQLLSILDKDESTAKSIMTFTTLIIVIFTVLGISVCIWKNTVQIGITFDWNVFSIVCSFKMVIRYRTLWDFCKNCQPTYFKDNLGIFCISGHICNQTQTYRLFEQQWHSDLLHADVSNAYRQTGQMFCSQTT